MFNYEFLTMFLDKTLGSISGALINYCFLLSGWILFRKKLTLVAAMCAFYVAMIFSRIDPLNYYIAHYYPEINQQFSTVIYAGILITLCTLQLFIKKRRSIDRIIITICLYAVSTTIVVFHSLIIYPTFPLIGKQIQKETSALIKLDNDSFMDACLANGYTCHVTRDISSVNASPTIQATIERIHKDTASITTKQPLLHTYHVIDERFDRDEMAFVTYYSFKGNSRVILAKEQAELAYHFVRRWFYASCSIAHFIWLSFGLFIVWLHNRMISKRQRLTLPSKLDCQSER